MALVLLGLAVSLVHGQLTKGFPVDTVRVMGPDINGAGPIDVTFAPGDTLGLVLWGSRAGRIDAHGSVLDSIPITVDTLADPDLGLAVIGVAETYVCALAENYGSLRDSAALVAVHVSRDGAVLGRTGVDSLRLTCGEPALATDGQAILLAWLSLRDRVRDVLCTRLDATGRPVDSVPVQLSDSGISASDVAIAFGDSTYLVVWVQRDASFRNEILVRLVRRDGSPVAGDPLRIGKCEQAEPVAAAYDGRNFVILWCGERQALRASRISEAGVVLDPGGVLVAEDRRQYHDLCSVDGVTLACWVQTGSDTGFVRGCRYDTALVALDTVPLYLSPAVAVRASNTTPASPSVAAWGTTFVVAWAHPSLGTPNRLFDNDDAVMRRVTSGGRLLDSACIVVPNSANAQLSAAVASDGAGRLAVWTDYRPAAAEEYCVRGVLLEPVGQPAAPAFTLGSRKSYLPHVAYGGGCYLALWYDSLWCVQGTRVSPVGRILDSIPIRIPEATASWQLRDIDFGGGVFFVLLTDEQYQPRAVRVTPEGSVLDSVPLQLTLSTPPHISSEAASDGHGFIVASRLYPSGPTVFVLVDSLGQLLYTQERVLSRYDHLQSVTYGDGCYLVFSRLDSKAWRVTTSGEILDTAGIDLPERFRPYACAYDGSSFALVASLPDDRTLTGVRVGLDGTVLNSVPVVLVDRADELGWDGVCADSSGYVTVVYVSECDSPYCSPRTWAAQLTMPDGVEAASGPQVGGFAVRPTPVRRRLTVDFASAGGTVRAVALFDASGRQVRSVPVHTRVRPGGVELDVRALPAGTYFVRVMPAGMARRFVIVR